MATKFVDDDAISYCGSFSGETFSSRRRHATCRMHPVDVIAKKLAEQKFEDEANAVSSTEEHTHQHRNRCNEFFHYYRYVVIMFAGISVGIMLVLRYSITVSILKMVNQTALYLAEHPNKTAEDFLAEGYSLGGDFNWNNEIQHAIMSWYMIAYTVPQIAATKAAVRIGSRLSTAIGLTICALSNLAIPVLSYWGWQYVVVMRLLNGIGGASVIPMMINLVEKWVPYDDFTLGLTIAQILITLMHCMNPLMTGYLCAIHWSYAFYMPSIAAIVFCILWLVLITDNPEENYFVSKKELDYICCCRTQDLVETPKQNDKLDKANGDKNGTVAVNLAEEDDDDSGEQYKPEKWTEILFLPQFYAYLVLWSLFCSSMSGFTFILPTYLRQFLKIPVDRNGIYCSIVQTGGIVAVTWPHPVLGFVQKMGFSISNSRKITYLFLCIFCAVSWSIVGSFHQYQLPLLFLNRCVHGGSDIIVTGTLMANFAKAGMSSFVFSIVNTVGNFAVVPVSALIGWLLDYTGQSNAGWCWVYQILAAFQLLMFLLFGIFINSDPIKFKKSKKPKELTEKKPPMALDNKPAQQESSNQQDTNVDKSSREKDRRNKLSDIFSEIPANNNNTRMQDLNETGEAREKRD